MGSAVPKQYLPVSGRTLLEHAVSALAADDRVSHVRVVVSADDERWRSLPLPGSRCRVVAAGGPDRAASVLGGLRSLCDDGAQAQDLVLVHDAARPCLDRRDLAALIDAAWDAPEGAILAAPVSDTLKRADPQELQIEVTVARERLWRALTPQCFAIGLLRRALEAHGSEPGITDEASAVERLGLHPRLVPGEATNLKVTTPDDLALAEAILRRRGEA